MTVFDTILRTLESVRSPHRATVDGEPHACVDGEEMRVQVSTNHWHDLIRQLERVKG
jgi:hypothetical protein